MPLADEGGSCLGRVTPCLEDSRMFQGALCFYMQARARTCLYVFIYFGKGDSVLNIITQIVVVDIVDILRIRLIKVVLILPLGWLSSMEIETSVLNRTTIVVPHCYHTINDGRVTKCKIAI